MPKCAWTQAPGSWLAARRSRAQGRGDTGTERPRLSARRRTGFRFVRDVRRACRTRRAWTLHSSAQTPRRSRRDGLSLSLDGELFLAGLSLPDFPSPTVGHTSRAHTTLRSRSSQYAHGNARVSGRVPHTAHTTLHTNHYNLYQLSLTIYKLAPSPNISHFRDSPLHTITGTPRAC